MGELKPKNGRNLHTILTPDLGEKKSLTELALYTSPQNELK